MGKIRKDAFAEIRKNLLQRRDELSGALERSLEELRQVRTPSPGNVMDAAIEALQGDDIAVLSQEVSRELRQVEDSLERMREGMFGICVICGVAIPLERLSALPHANNCIRCQRRSEGNFCRYVG